MSAPAPPPAAVDGWASLDAEFSGLLAGVELLPSSEAEFQALDPEGPLLCEVRCRLFSLGYACPPPGQGVGLRGAIARFQEEAGLEVTGWLGVVAWDALAALVALDAATEPARWRDAGGAWRPAYRRAACWRLAALGQAVALPLDGPPSETLIREALAAFERSAVGWGWQGAGGAPDRAAAVLFDHRALVALLRVRDGPESFVADEGAQVLGERVLAAETGLSGWADEPALAKEGWIELGTGAEEGPDVFGLDEGGDFGAGDTFEVLAALAQRHGDQLQEAVDEVRRLGRAGGLWDGLRVAFGWLSRWARRIRKGLVDLAQVGRAVLRQAARVIHGLGTRVLASVRDALRYLASLGGPLYRGPQACVVRSPDGDLSLLVARDLTAESLGAAREGLRAWSRGHAAACEVVAVVVRVIVDLMSGPVGWALLIVRLVQALWRAGLFHSDIIEEAEAGGWTSCGTWG
ncbi:MAG: peptidoglycan-binding domain-containing protein [Pseudomonadota bacterium]